MIGEIVKDLGDELLIRNGFLERKVDKKWFYKKRFLDNNNIGSNIYIMKIEGENVYKIGHSENPKRRLSGVRLKTSKKVSLVCFYPVANGCKSETAIHKILHKYRLYSEWFQLDDNTLDHVKTLIKEYQFKYF